MRSAGTEAGIVKEAKEIQLHAKNMAASNQFTELLSTTRNRQVKQHFDSSHKPVGLHSILRPDEWRYTQCRTGHPVISFGATKPPAHPEDGDGVSS